ncbi:hypothetical protein Pfo_018982 [Paulownia fortunei]|nr:hypothetical protein Pfo_018982 [Paulownia fortunei]
MTTVMQGMINVGINEFNAGASSSSQEHFEGTNTEPYNAYTDKLSKPLVDSFGAKKHINSEPDKITDEDDGYDDDNDDDDDDDSDGVEIDNLEEIYEQHDEGNSSQHQVLVYTSVSSTTNKYDSNLRHTGTPFWSLHGGKGALHPRVIHMLYDMGFYVVYRCGYFDMDFYLITALVERWRPKTHTFYFRIGEVTVTLQGVAIIWGLPVDGEPIIGFRGECILLSALRGYLQANPVTDDTLHDELEQYARGCALILLGSIMCPDSSGNRVSLLYLQSMEQIKDVVYFSWGSAILSFMYRELCTASDKDKNVIGGAIIWAWSHITMLVPRRLHSRVNMSPLIDASDHELLLPPYDFIWESYDMSSPDIMVLGPRCNTPLWRSRCPLINYAIMEFHHLERVMPQFGIRQYIPQNIPAHEQTLHNANRHQFIIVNPPITRSDSIEPRYMDWYDGITRHLISLSHLPMEEGY